MGLVVCGVRPNRTRGLGLGLRESERGQRTGRANGEIARGQRAGEAKGVPHKGARIVAPVAGVLWEPWQSGSASSRQKDSCSSALHEDLTEPSRKSRTLRSSLNPMRNIPWLEPSLHSLP
ncbi:MAG: hypothetical protein ACI9EF_002191 [Pseudohongiellaceae bacterium]